MNTNVLLAFVGGAVLASGIVYLAVKPDAAVKTAPVPVAATTTPVPSEPVASAAPAASAEPVTQPPAQERKPPPIAPATRHERPARRAEVAQAQPPLRQPINQQRPINDAGKAEPQDSPPAPIPPPPQVQSPPPQVPQKVEAAPPPAPHSVTIQPGALLSVRIGETLSTKRNKPGDTFLATLDQPLVVDGFVIAERGARVEGRVTEADPGGRVKGVAELGLELVKLSTADGQHIRIATTSFIKQASESRKTDAAKVGGGAALGAIIGAIAGGGKGAGVGAGVGGAAGAGDVLLTRGQAAEIPVETRVSFRLNDPVTITERLN